jgi:hypothetical protein
MFYRRNYYRSRPSYSGYGRRNSYYRSYSRSSSWRPSSGRGLVGRSYGGSLFNGPRRYVRPYYATRRGPSVKYAALKAYYRGKAASEKLLDAVAPDIKREREVKSEDLENLSKKVKIEPQEFASYGPLPDDYDPTL